MPRRTYDSLIIGGEFVAPESTEQLTLVSPVTQDGIGHGGCNEGARCVTGCGRLPSMERGSFVEPTIFADATPGISIVREEIFGPVVSVLSYRDEDDAVATANDPADGLNGSVFTADLDRGLRVAARMQSGTVELNGSPSGYYAPMGGVRASGIGRENGPEGLDTYDERKSIGLSAAAAEFLAAHQNGPSYR